MEKKKRRRLSSFEVPYYNIIMVRVHESIAYMHGGHRKSCNASVQSIESIYDAR